MSLSASLSLLPNFAAYLGLSVLLLVIFCFVYVQLTPHHEFALIKQNNAAASLAFGGSVLGFCIALHSAVSNSVNLADCAIWGLVALVVQALVFNALRLVISDLPRRITENEVAAGGLVAALSLGVGLLNAASMSYQP